MFDFEKLDVYQEIREVNRKVLPFLNAANHLPDFIRENFKTATLNILLNLSEGTGRMGKQEKKSCYTAARGNVFVCVALLQTLIDLNLIDYLLYEEYYQGYERISKMLLGMIRSSDLQSETSAT
jgi:four helix bundle protein